jgi:hypothetical protein
MSQHPFDAPRNSNNSFQDAIDFAHDLAYGAMNGYWGAVISLFRGRENIMDEDVPMHKKFRDKWPLDDTKRPEYDILISLGYFELMPERQNNSMTAYVRILKPAFELLSAPFAPSRVFISYRRRESSAFALLLEARLRIAGMPSESIFVDKNMTGGERWEARIYREIESTDYFVCLIGPTTLTQGSWVNKEIDTLKQVRPQAIVIPVCHNGTRLGQLPSSLASSNGYEIGKPLDEETALDYEMATNFVLNALGYKTY